MTAVLRACLTHQGRRFELYEPSPADVDLHAATLAGWYNEPANVAMMEGSGVMDEADVAAFWQELRAAGGRGFFARVDGALVGDLDLRSVRGRTAELAIMIGERQRQGRGVGRVLAATLLVVAFRELGLEKVYAPSRRDNARMRAMAASLGFVDDESDEARALLDSDACTTQSVTASSFRALHADAWSAVRVDSASAPPLTGSSPRAT
ncbi:MAG: GNAT family N-acetyltransferase [Myxococcales bacterium]|nr:GNAT family N-acetyltransferase [Myxococcales bacterium]